MNRITSLYHAYGLIDCLTTAYRGFTESLRRSAKTVLLSAKPLPRVALVKGLSTHLLSAKRLLPRAIHRALGKGFAESHRQLSAEKSSRYGVGGLTATLPRAVRPSSRQRFILFFFEKNSLPKASRAALGKEINFFLKIVFAESLQEGSRQRDKFFF